MEQEDEEASKVLNDIKDKPNAGCEGKTKINESEATGAEAKATTDLINESKQQYESPIIKTECNEKTETVEEEKLPENNENLIKGS